MPAQPAPTPVPGPDAFRGRATYVATYDTAEGLQKVLEMGVVEGASAAINQIDELVAS